MILSETLFMPFLLAGLMAIGTYLRQRQNCLLLVIAGGLLGIGAWVRPVVMYFPLVIACTLIVFDFKKPTRWLHTGTFLLVFILTLSPWLLRNHHYFGKLIMSGQQSNMLANYHVPVVWESALGVPFWEGHERIKKQVRHSIKDKAKSLQRQLTAVERNEVEQQLALQELSKFPVHYLKQWFFGTMKTMNGANLLGLYHAFDYRVERLRFFEIKSTEFKDKVFIFLVNQDYAFIFEVLLRVLISGFALLGVFAIVKKKDCFLWLIMLANFYFICTPGPMGYARFRFPIEVFWFIQAYLGFTWLYLIVRQKKLV